MNHQASDPGFEPPLEPAVIRRKNTPRARVALEGVFLVEARRLFALHGYDGTSIREIAHAAGSSSAALYHYFEDKSEIYARVVEDVLRQLCTYVESRVDGSRTAEARLRQFMVAWGEYFEHNTHGMIASSLGFQAIQNSEHRAIVLAWRDRFENIVRSALRDGVNRGEFRIDNVALAGRALLSCLNWMHRWYRPDGPQRPVDIAQAYLDMFLVGIRNAAPVVRDGKEEE